MFDSQAQVHHRPENDRALAHIEPLNIESFVLDQSVANEAQQPRPQQARVCQQAP
jgi:hypothetical protein